MNNPPGYIDPFGDDSDLMREDSVQQSNPDHEVINVDSPLESNTLRGLPEMMHSVSWINHMVGTMLEQENTNVETEALMYAVSELAGAERLEELLSIARHRQRAQMWEQLAEVFKLLVEATPADPAGDVGPAAAIIAQKSAETLYHIASKCYAVHLETYQIKKGEYDESRVSGKTLSFNFWVTKAPEILDTLRHKMDIMKKLRKH